jgi:hypothetical protein
MRIWAAIVTLDRVVCCYPDYRQLLEQVAESTIDLLALSYPRDRWYVRLGVGAENLLRRLHRQPLSRLRAPGNGDDPDPRPSGASLWRSAGDRVLVG